jgi:hypothetical protein
MRRRTLMAVAALASEAAGVRPYQVNDDRLALELTANATKYYKDSDLS